MLEIFKTNEKGELIEQDDFESGCWINLCAPTEDELSRLEMDIGVLPDLLRAPLDEEEKAHIEIEPEQTLIIVDIPWITNEDGRSECETMPLGIILMEDYFITVCLRENDAIENIKKNRLKEFFTYKRTRFTFQILLVTAKEFLRHLRYIDKKNDEVEKELRKSMKNKELFMLMELERSLVFFTTSLKSNEIVLERLLRGKCIKMYDEDQELLEDVIIENKQAIEMANIYSSITSGMMDAFASIISNNLNIVMKILASITIAMSVPTAVASFFGMNVGGVPWSTNPLGFWYAIGTSVVLMGISIWWLWKRKMF